MKRIGVVLTVCWLIAAAATADSGWGRHQKLCAVPRPGKVAIDGQLGEWNRNHDEHSDW